MTIKSITRVCIYLFCTLFYSFTHAQQPPLALTQEDQKMLAELDNEINSFVDNLPPEQQQQFWKDVEELTETMNKMKPDELDNFIQGVFSGEVTELPTKEKPQPKPTPKPQPQKPTITPEPTKPKPKPIEQIQLPEIKKAIESIEVVIDQIETFLRKTQIIPDVESKVEGWAKRGRIRAWQHGKKWHRFKAQIDELVQKLYKAKDRDPKTKQYNYISILVTNKSLVNNLEHLGTVLKQHVSEIQAPEFGQTRLTKSARTAIQQVSSIIGEALFITKITEELDAIFEGFSSIAAQRHAQEEKARATAATGRQPLVPRPAIGGGRVSPYSGGYNYDSPGMYGQGGPSSYTPSRPTTRSRISKPTRRKSKPDASKKSGQPTKKTGEPAKKGDAKKTSKKSSTPKDSAAEGYLDEVIDNIEKSIDVIEEYDATLKNIKNHLTDSKEVKVDVAMFSLPQAIKATHKATDKIKALNRRTGRLEVNAQKKKYRESLKKSKMRKKLEILEKLGSDIKSVKDDWNKIESKVSADKQYAYIGGRNVANASANIKQTITSPSSIYELQREIEKLVEAVEELEKGK